MALYEFEKLAEAKIFLQKMKEGTPNQNEFNAYLTAFIISSRSILQFMLKDSEQSPALKDWYDKALRKSKLIKYFRDLRNIVVHERPLESTKHVSYSMKSRVSKRIYYLEDWKEKEDCMTLCSKYFNELENLLEEGKTKGFIG